MHPVASLPNPQQQNLQGFDIIPTPNLKIDLLAEISQFPRIIFKSVCGVGVDLGLGQLIRVVGVRVGMDLGEDLIGLLDEAAEDGDFEST
ncbi:unnamed protein product [Prunus brigantina]